METAIPKQENEAMDVTHTDDAMNSEGVGEGEHLETDAPGDASQENGGGKLRYIIVAT